VLTHTEHFDHEDPDGDARQEDRRCVACGRKTFSSRSWYCKARLCPHYAPIWARDQQRKCFENLSGYEAGDGTAVMFTITAPGRRELPWDEGHCAALGKHRHSGLLGCRVEPSAAREWNLSCSERYGRLRVAARALTKRNLGSRFHKLHYRAL